MILKQVHDTNMRAKGYPERVFSVSTVDLFKKLPAEIDVWGILRTFKMDYAVVLMSFHLSVGNSGGDQSDTHYVHLKWLYNK